MLHLLGARHQLLDVAEAIQQGVFGVDVKVDEGHAGTGIRSFGWDEKAESADLC